MGRETSRSAFRKLDQLSSALRALFLDPTFDRLDVLFGGCPGSRGTSVTGPWLSSHFLIVLRRCDGYSGDFGLERFAQGR